MKVEQRELKDQLTRMFRDDIPFEQIRAQDERAGKGRWVLIDFWATWCVPCVNEILHLQQVYREFHDKGLEIYAISPDNDTTRWLEYVARHDMPWINVTGIDADRKIPAAETYAISSIPSNLLISPEGVIVARNLRTEGVPEGITLHDELTKRLSTAKQHK